MRTEGLHHLWIGVVEDKAAHVRFGAAPVAGGVGEHLLQIVGGIVKRVLVQGHEIPLIAELAVSVLAEVNLPLPIQIEVVSARAVERRLAADVTTTLLALLVEPAADIVE